MSKQLAVYVNNIMSFEEDFVSVANTNECSLTFKQEAQFAIQALENNDFLKNIALSQPQSLRNAVLNIGAIGLTLNPVEKKAYLIPRKGKVCLDVSYIGLVDIACQLGSIRFVQAKIVYEKDTFEYNGVSSEPTHQFSAFDKNRGEMVGVYCIAKTNDGDFLTETMTTEEINNIRGRSEAFKKGSGPWKTDYTEMVKKTIIKRASKLWPKTDKTIRLDTAIGALNEHEGIDFEEERREQEISDKEKREAREAQLKNAQQQTDLKYKLIEEITGLSAGICRDKDVAGKIIFMTDILKVKNFTELRSKKIEDLELLIENLKDLS